LVFVGVPALAGFSSPNTNLPPNKRDLNESSRLENQGI
jgi:hypothetical protein